MLVEQWPTEKPIPYARNASKLSPKAVDKVAASIREFGFRQPIVVDKDGTVVVGHTRLAAAKKLELATVPVHVATELTPAQIKAYRLADNRTNEETEWDMELLGLEMLDLKDLACDWRPWVARSSPGSSRPCSRRAARWLLWRGRV